MTRRLIVLQHHPVEGVGDLGLWAHRLGIELAIHRSDLGDLPQAASGPCVLLGGPHSINNPPDWLRNERGWLHVQLAAGMPVLGICLGAQLLADALGGSVRPLARPETGWARIDFIDGIGLDALEWHEDEVTLPPNGRLLASSAACRVQMFEVDGLYTGMQFHPEWNAEMLASLNAHFGTESPLPRQADVQRHSRIAAWFHRWLNAWWAV